jgi:uncharacterized protein (TIGR02996 family)
MPPPGYEPFLRAICANPEDDTARLAYADWLDENGDADRAEFIRLQISLHADALPEGDRGATEARVAELLGRNEAAWRAELPGLPGVTWVTFPHPFVRGFAHAVGIKHGKAWREHADVAFAAAPVSSLTCGGTFSARTSRPIHASPLLGRVAEFQGAHFDTEGAEAFATNPHLVGRLRKLRISSAQDADAVAAVLARASGIRNLEWLGFGAVGVAGVAALAASPQLTRLRDLLLHLSKAGDDGAEAIAASPYLAAVEQVLLNYAGVGDRGAVVLARSTRLRSLRQLYLGGCARISDAAAVGIAASTGLPALTDLHLWGSGITDTGARALAGFAERRGLQVLNLRSCPLSGACAEEMSARLGRRFVF